MTTYAGDRTIDGIVATADGAPLEAPPRFSRRGFEWSYEGAEPTQLAFAILADHLGDAEAAAASADRFMRAVVANLGNEWELSSTDVDRALAALAGTHA